MASALQALERDLWSLRWEEATTRRIGGPESSLAAIRKSKADIKRKMRDVEQKEAAKAGEQARRVEATGAQRSAGAVKREQP